MLDQIKANESASLERLLYRLPFPRRILVGVSYLANFPPSFLSTVVTFQLNSGGGGRYNMLKIINELPRLQWVEPRFA